MVIPSVRLRFIRAIAPPPKPRPAHADCTQPKEQTKSPMFPSVTIVNILGEDEQIIPVHALSTADPLEQAVSTEQLEELFLFQRLDVAVRS